LFICGGAEDLSPAVHGATALVVLDLRGGCVLPTHAGTLGEGDILGAGLGGSVRY